MPSNIIYHEAPAKEVAETAETILEATDGVESNVVHMACIGVAIALQDPDITASKIVPLIKNVSEYIALLIMDKDELGKKPN